MKLKSISNGFLLISLIGIIFSCAQVVAPTGGERDILPPEIVSTSPESASLNFKSDEIIIEFNEYVKLVKLKDELIVSPPLKYRLETEIKGKKLKLAFKDTLKENKSYVLNFGNAIVDITENNPIGNFRYVFSTGDKIDTLSISGRVIDAFDSKARSGVLVMLYDSYEDSIPLKELPNYVARTNKEGLYKLENVKEGEYKIFVLKDKNSNYLFDRSDEAIAFDTLPLLVDENIDSLNFYLFQEDREKQFVDKQIEKGSHLLLKMNRRFETISIEGLDTNLETLILNKEIGLNRDSVSIWFKEMKDQRLSLIVDDSLDFRDTLSIIIDSNEIALKLSFPQVDNYFQNTLVQSSTPVLKINKELIKLWDADSNLIDFKLNEMESKLQFSLDFIKDPGNKYFLLFEPGAIIDIYGSKTDSITESLSFNEVEDFGKLLVKVEAATNSKQLIQLLNEKGDVLRQSNLLNDQVEFNYLRGGKYRLKLILDRNDNGTWDTGDYLNKIYPEETLLFDEPITIRSNWDKEINWKIK